MNNEVTVTLTAEEKAAEQKCISDIANALNASYTLVANSLTEVKDRKLWREYPSLNEWGLATVGFGKREIDIYISGNATLENIKLIDPFASPKLTHLQNIGKFDTESQAAVWEAAKELGNGKITNNDIIEAGEKLITQGTARLRENVTRLRNNGQSSFLERAKREWFNLDDAQKAELLTHWLKLEEESFVFVVKALAEKQIEDNDKK